MPGFSRSNVAIKRIFADMKELATQPSDQYQAAPREDDLFDWHFTLRGPPGTDFEGGLYHGRILLPSDYPFKPPNIIFLTPNGRFEVRKKICLSISAYHPEEWQPAWGVRTILEALISFFTTKGEGAVGALDWSKDERQRLVKPSQEWTCKTCGRNNRELIPKLRAESKSCATTAGECKTAASSNPYAAQIAQMHFHSPTSTTEIRTASEQASQKNVAAVEESASPDVSGDLQRTNQEKNAAAPLRHRHVTQHVSSNASPLDGQTISRSQLRNSNSSNVPTRRRDNFRDESSRNITTSGEAGSQSQSLPAEADEEDKILLYVAIALGLVIAFILARKLLKTFR